MSGLLRKLQIESLQAEYQSIHRRALQNACRPGDPEVEKMMAREREIFHLLRKLGAPMVAPKEDQS